MGRIISPRFFCCAWERLRIFRCHRTIRFVKIMHISWSSHDMINKEKEFSTIGKKGHLNRFVTICN